MLLLIFKKLCSYCLRLVPEDEIEIVLVGKYRNLQRARCIHCTAARNNPKASEARLAEIVEERRRRIRIRIPSNNQKEKNKK